MGKMKILDDGTIVSVEGVIKQVGYEEFYDFAPPQAPQVTRPNPPIARRTIRREEEVVSLWWQADVFYWLISIVVSVVIAIPLAIFVAPLIFDNIYIFEGSSNMVTWFSDLFSWVSNVLRVASPWAVGIGGVVGTIGFGVFRSMRLEGTPYEIIEYIVSILCVLLGMVALPVALFLLAVAIGLAIIGLGIAIVFIFIKFLLVDKK